MEIILKGTVSSGFGKGKFFTQIDWVMKEFLTKLGFVPYPGTLNLEISKSDWETLIKFRQDGGVKIEPENNQYCSAICYSAQINNTVNGAVVMPEATKHQKRMLEVVAALNIRNFLNLETGDVVTLTLNK